MFVILSGKEFAYSKANRDLFQNAKMEIEVMQGRKGHYDTILGTMKGFKSRYINRLKEYEVGTIVDAIVNLL